MCTAPKPPAAPPVSSEPTRADVAKEEAMNRIQAVRDNKKRWSRQQGIFQNIGTTPSGDPLYGSAANAKALLGGGD